MASPTVYIVDDDIHLVRALTRLLRTHGYKVQSFTSAAHFSEYEQPRGPACLLLDLKMPEVNGLDLQKILAHPIP